MAYFANGLECTMKCKRGGKHLVEEEKSGLLIQKPLTQTLDNGFDPILKNDLSMQIEKKNAYKFR